MHTTGYLLVLAVLMASAYKTIVRTYEPANKLKQAVSNEIVASAGLGAFSLFGLGKSVDRARGRKILKSIESRLSRPAFKLDQDRIPFYKLIALDGSEHAIVGTLHTSITIAHLPEDSRILIALEEATHLISEIALDSASELLQIQPKKLKTNVNTDPSDFDLRQALGDAYMDKLNAEIASVSLHGYLSRVECMQPAVVLKTLKARCNAAFPKLFPLDMGLALKASESGKEVLALEKVSEVYHLVNIDKPALNDQVALQELKKFLDAGGVDNRIKEINTAINAYVDGDIRRYMKFRDWHEGASSEAEIAALNHRNHAWVKQGTIQKNCKHGNKCLIAVGLGHLEDDNTDTLIELLTAEGFKIERLMD